MLRHICAVLLLSCALRQCTAVCFYQRPGECTFLDDESQECNQCTDFSDSLINVIPATIPVSKHIGACGCVIAAFSRCADVFSAVYFISSPSDCTRTGQILIDNILTGQPCLNCTLAPAPTSKVPMPAPTLEPSASASAQGAPTPAPALEPSASTPSPNAPTLAPTPAQRHLEVEVEAEGLVVLQTTNLSSRRTT